MGRNPLFIGNFLQLTICFLFCLFRQVWIVLQVVWLPDKPTLFSQAPANTRNTLGSPRPRELYSFKIVMFMSKIRIGEEEYLTWVWLSQVDENAN